jgi:hypothetical protein
MRFPSVTGSSLSGKHYSLPRDFEGTYNVAITAYQRSHQSSVDSWEPLLLRLAEQHPELRFYELPTLPEYGWLERRLIDGGMRGGIAGKAVRARTITLYVDVGEFNAALGQATTAEIHVFLVDRQGEILWRADGDYTPQKGDSLSQALDDLAARDGESTRGSS